MKYSKAFVILTSSLVTTAGPAFSQEALGVNYNQFLQSIQEQEVSQVKATWIRGFLDMHLLGDQDPSQNADILPLVHGAKRISSECLQPLSQHRETRCGQLWDVTILD